jgi:hypothetical protein
MSSKRQPLSEGTGGARAVQPKMVPKDEYKQRKELDEARKVSKRSNRLLFRSTLTVTVVGWNSTGRRRRGDGT